VSGSDEPEGARPAGSASDTGSGSGSTRLCGGGSPAGREPKGRGGVQRMVRRMCGGFLGALVLAGCSMAMAVSGARAIWGISQAPLANGPGLLRSANRQSRSGRGSTSVAFRGGVSPTPQARLSNSSATPWLLWVGNNVVRNANRSCPRSDLGADSCGTRRRLPRLVERPHLRRRGHSTRHPNRHSRIPAVKSYSPHLG